MIRFVRKSSVLLALSAFAVTTAFGASVPCPEGPGPAYGIAKAAAAEGHLNLAFFSLDRVVRASAAKADPAEFLAALACLDAVQERNGLVDLPNYETELRGIVPRVKTTEGAVTISRFAFRSILQRISGGATSDAALAPLRTLVKGSAFYASATTGLAAAANANYAVAKPALRKALALATDASTAFTAELKLALARSLYATGEDAAAISEYESLYRIGAPMQDALIESGWAHLRGRNYVKSIGLSYELSTGKLSQFFAPEAASIRAIGFVENCRYAESRGAIARFSAEYAPVAQWLRSAARTDLSLYETAIARSEGAIGAESIPERVWSMWSTSDLFISLQSGIRSAFAEERSAIDWAADQAPAFRDLLVTDLKKLPALRARAATRVETHLARLDDGMAKRIARESERLRFVRIEASQGAGRDLVYRNANPALAEVEKNVAKADRKAKSYSGKLAWGKVAVEDPAAEMWIDEIGNFEAKSLDRCKAKAEFKKLQAAR